MGAEEKADRVVELECSQGLSLEDLTVSGLLCAADGEFEKGLTTAEVELTSLGLRETKGKILMQQTDLEQLMKEMSRRASTAHLLPDVAARLEEVRRIIRTAEDAQGQPLTRVHAAEVKKILSLCTTLEAQCMSALASIEIDTLTEEMGSRRKKRGTTLVQDQQVFREMRGREKLSGYTKDLFQKLLRLEAAPVTRSEHAYTDETEDVSDWPHLGPEAETEVGLTAGFFFYFMSPGTYHVGTDVGGEDDAPVVKASRLLNVLPMGVVGDTEDGHRHLHHGWTEALLGSMLPGSTRFPHHQDLEGLHFSSHPAAEFRLEVHVNITRDVVRRSHMRKLADTYPHVRKFLRDKNIDLEAPPTIDQPIFQDGALKGYTQLAAETVADGAVDAEFDHALELPFTVASELAELLGARIPTWQEWESVVRNGCATKFAWGDAVNTDCIDVVTRTFADGAAVNVVDSFGWLKHTTECPVESVYRYGAEWNAVNRDLGDATGGLAEHPTTHIYRSACDYGVCWHPELGCTSQRSFTFPCPAAYGLPWRGVHSAAFRLAYCQQQPPKKRPIIDASELVSLLEVSADAQVNLGRIEGLLGPPETKTPAGNGVRSETWWWLSLGISLEITLSQGHRVVAITVHDENHAVPRPYSRYQGRVTGSMQFPLAAGKLEFPKAVGDPVICGNCKYITVPSAAFAVTDGAKEALRPGKAPTAASKALVEALRFQDQSLITVCAAVNGDRIASLCFSL
eukprot:TRINITY_DN25498_c0_g1_i1.p1 TRINITY_DN25498_c0_g1~~TRINITY_DN25498_c0_g1_i1.p1  ORF type:complete len:739 (+),score=200.34 TRINITY_DN25498_c0_g1_i1:72-2288(+)